MHRGGGMHGGMPMHVAGAAGGIPGQQLTSGEIAMLRHSAMSAQQFGLAAKSKAEALEVRCAILEERVAALEAEKARTNRLLALVLAQLGIPVDADPQPTAEGAAADAGAAGEATAAAPASVAASEAADATAGPAPGKVAPQSATATASTADSDAEQPPEEDPPLGIVDARYVTAAVAAPAAPGAAAAAAAGGAVYTAVAPDAAGGSGASTAAVYAFVGDFGKGISMPAAPAAPAAGTASSSPAEVGATAATSDAYGAMLTAPEDASAGASGGATGYGSMLTDASPAPLATPPAPAALTGYGALQTDGSIAGAAGTAVSAGVAAPPPAGAASAYGALVPADAAATSTSMPVEPSFTATSSSAASAPLQAPSAPAAVRDWNREWQAACDLPVATTTQRLTRCVAMHAVSSAFSASCTATVRAIVDDLMRPPHQRIMKSVDIGGIAGGESVGRLRRAVIRVVDCAYAACSTMPRWPSMLYSSRLQAKSSCATAFSSSSRATCMESTAATSLR